MAASAPTPSPEGFMSTSAKMSLADIALALRDEQLEAKVVHYKAELATSPELDAVTQQVIDELQILQAAARRKAPLSHPPAGGDRAQLEIDLIKTLKEMLGRIFRPEKLATIIERKGGKSKQSTFRLKGVRFGGVGGGVGPHEWAGGRQFGGPGRSWAPGSRWRSVMPRVQASSS